MEPIPTTTNELISYLETIKNRPVFNFDFTGKQQRIRLEPGVYSFECWGASGSNYSQVILGGNGAYTFGKIRIDSFRDLYVYVGQTGTKYSNAGVFGGGGFSDYSGGGASDIRLLGKNDFEGKKSRIMVAAGGGGADSLESGGSGGTISGKNSGLGYSKGATQTTPGTGFVPGSFGQGGGNRKEDDNNGGGGGGYYGGGSGSLDFNNGGSGGSSYISGHPECNAVSISATEDNIVHTNHTRHNSGFVFFDTMMIDGDSDMPNPHDSPQLIHGNNGNGFVRIRKISNIYVIRCGNR